MGSQIGPFFVGVDTDSLIRVREVDDSFAYIETLLPAAATYSMPIADYDERFILMYRPATAANLRELSAKHFRLPVNAPEAWK